MQREPGGKHSRPCKEPWSVHGCLQGYVGNAGGKKEQSACQWKETVRFYWGHHMHDTTEPANTL